MSIRRVPSNSDSSGAGGEKKAHLQEQHVHALSTKEVDSGAQIVAGLSAELDPAEAAHIRFALADSGISTVYSLEASMQEKD